MARNIWPPVLKKFKGLLTLFTGLMKGLKNGSGKGNGASLSPVRRHREDINTAFKICKFYPDLKYKFSFQPREGLRGHGFLLAERAK